MNHLQHDFPKDLSLVSLEDLTDFLSQLLKDDLLTVNEIDKSELHMKFDCFAASLTENYFGRIFHITTADCICTCFFLASSGFNSLETARYGPDALYAVSNDYAGNIFVIEERRVYEFELAV